MKDQSTFFIFITNNCNLKCLGCMQSCDRITNPYYMSSQELIKCLKILQKKKFVINGSPVETIHLTGGDPLTHPNWIAFCKIVHSYLPDICIDVSTNGLLLNKYSDEELISLTSKYNVTFQLSIYADINLLQMYKRIIERFTSLNIPFSFKGSSHFFFSKQDKTTEKINPARDYGENCYQMLSHQNHVIFYQGKIYSCWKDINILQKEKHLIDDAYEFNEATPVELIQNKKHYYCDICRCHNGSGGEEFILWDHHNKNANEIFNFNLKELFINNYSLYYSLQHKCTKHIEVLKDELFQKYLPENQKYYANTRFLNGKGDIFIPFSNEIPYQLKQFLNNISNIDNYNIYFVSINNSSETEEKIYNMFLPYNKGEKLNNYHLKANNLFHAYNTFLNNSYLQNKFIIDINQKNLQLLPLQ